LAKESKIEDIFGAAKWYFSLKSLFLSVIKDIKRFLEFYQSNKSYKNTNAGK
jgi:hypothetical protein